MQQNQNAYQTDLNAGQDFRPRYVAGLDEVGMGPVAGPVTVAVVAFPFNYPPIKGVKDSKKLSAKKREELAPLIVQQALFVGVGWASPRFIDHWGLATAWQAAATAALKNFPTIGKLIVDGNILVESYGGMQEAIVKADDLVWEVSAASIVAKVMRDQEMREAAEVYGSHYLWESNKGYPTPAHLDAIREWGPTSYHRRTYLKKKKWGQRRLAW